MSFKITKISDYSTTDNFELLKEVSGKWTETYNFILGFENLEEWEKRTLEQLILSEKVFDV